jgi:hypothetical protein
MEETLASLQYQSERGSEKEQGPLKLICLASLAWTGYQERMVLARRDMVRPLALTMFVFGLLAWLYVVAIQITHPEWLPEAFSHLKFPPFNWRLDTVGMLAFAVAVVGFFLWQLTQVRSSRR